MGLLSVRVVRDSLEARQSQYIMNRLTYFEPSDPTPNGVILVIHGMNNNAGMMDPLIKVINDCGIIAARLTLAGHDCIVSTKFDGSLSVWLADVQLAYKNIVERYPNSKVSGLGFSLGGALLVTSIDQYPAINFEKLILLAPALRLRWYLRMLQPLCFLGRLKYSVPNFVPAAYRTYRFSPVTNYASTSDAVRAVTRLSNPDRFSETKVLLAMSLKDNLLHLRGMPRWLRLNRLASWELVTLNAQPEIAKTLNHLVVDQQTLGASEWQRLTNIIRQFLEK